MKQLLHLLQLHGNDNEIHTLNANNWLCYKQVEKTKPADLDQIAWDMFVNVGSRKLIYPRIKFSSLSLKTDSTNLKIKYNGHELMDAADYRVNTRDTLRDSLYFMEYYITIKPETLVKYGLGHSFNINYVLSNANTAIYLDALKISQENAYPKVSYEVAVNLLNDNSIIPTLYNRRAQIVMINDTDLKFKNVFGYISQVELNLDDASQDTIEVKNYKTKFEDIFSTIVAQTEQMKRMGEGFIAAASGEVPLSESTFATTMNQNTNILQAYLDSHFDSSQVVRDKLTSLFNEAGEILANSNKSLNKMKALTLENASILAGFAQNISAELSGQVYKSPTRPASFKPNDVWIQTDEQGNIIGKYLATSFSTESSANGTAGFVRTYDGSLASITGAALNIDAEAGIVDIEAQNQINIKSGNSIYIAANENVEIVGNKKVNIGGTEINLCTLAEKVLDPVTNEWHYISNSEKTTSGINLIAGAYREDEDYASNVSRVLLKPTKIEMGAAELELKAESKMNFITSYGQVNNTSAVHISSTDGIWIGTGTTQGVRIFSGEIKLRNNGTVDTSITKTTGASIELNSEHLILGYANTKTNSATAIEMNEKFVIIAAGDQITGNTTTDDGKRITGTSEGLVGAKFTKDSIGFTTAYTENNTTKYNALLMDGTNGITIGSGSINVTASTGTLRASTGSYVRIASNGIDIGSLANLYINSNNFKLQTDTYANGTQKTSLDNTILAVGSDLQSIDADTAYDSTSGVLKKKTGNTYTDLAVTPSVDLLLNKNGLYIRGTVYAAAGSFTGDVSASTFTATSNKGKFMASGDNLGFYAANDTPIMTLNGTTMTVNTGYTFNISGALSLAADSNKFIINSSTPKLYMANNATWANATSGLQYADNTLSIKGAITATALNIVTNGTSASIEEYVNGKISGAQVSVTDERIWEGVTNYANGGTNTGGLLITAGQVKLSANDTYIDINTTGIKMEGQHIYINGQQEWSRDDIIVMKSSGNTPADAPWQDTVEHIQNYMEGEAVTINNVTYQRGSAAI